MSMLLETGLMSRIWSMVTFYWLKKAIPERYTIRVP